MNYQVKECFLTKKYSAEKIVRFIIFQDYMKNVFRKRNHAQYNKQSVHEDRCTKIYITPLKLSGWWVNQDKEETSLLKCID